MNEERANKGWFGFYFREPVAAMAEGRLSAKFTSFDQVSDWVKGYGEEGELMLRVWLAREENADETSLTIARIWLEKTEANRVYEHAQEELKIARKSAQSAENSARWTMYAAIFAFSGTLITSIVAIFGYIQAQKPVEVKLLNSQEMQLPLNIIKKPASIGLETSPAK